MSIPFNFSEVRPSSSMRIKALKSMEIIQQELSNLQKLAECERGKPYEKLINEDHFNQLRIKSHLLENWILNHNK
jgi:hypothetical protein